MKILWEIFRIISFSLFLLLSHFIRDDRPVPATWSEDRSTRNSSLFSCFAPSSVISLPLFHSSTRQFREIHVSNASFHHTKSPTKHRRAESSIEVEVKSVEKMHKDAISSVNCVSISFHNFSLYHISFARANEKRFSVRQQLVEFSIFYFCWRGL